MPGGERKSADSALIAALAGGATVGRAARAAGVSEATAHRRLRNATFRRKVARARAATVERAVAKLSKAAAQAVAMLRRLSTGAESENVRLSASRAILEFVFKGNEQLTIQERLRELEAEIFRRGVPGGKRNATTGPAGNGDTRSNGHAH